MRKSAVPALKTGIKWQETYAEKLFAEKLSFSRAGKYNWNCANPEPDLNETLHVLQKEKLNMQQISSLAFGGRGVGLLHKERITRYPIEALTPQRGFREKGGPTNTPTSK